MNSLRIRVFGIIREIVGSGEIVVELAGPLSTGALLDRLAEDHPGLMDWKPYLRVAVNHEYAPGGATITPGDEVAVIPPVSGG